MDTGASNLGPETGQLFMNMHVEGIAPTDIDTVILTHDIQTTSAGMLIAKASWLFRMLATSCGRARGISGTQN